MMSITELTDILNLLMDGDISPLNNPKIIKNMSEEAVKILNCPEPLDDYDVTKMNIIISISQLVYNNTDRTVLFLEDGIYDLLLELDKKYNSSVQVGAPEVSFNDGTSTLNGRKSMDGIQDPFIYLSNVNKYNSQELFKEDLTRVPPIDHSYFDATKIIDRNSGVVLSKKKVQVSHKYPTLVGTLDKCKFVLNKDAADKRVINDSNVAIFERDFLGKHLNMGLFDKNRVLTMIAEIKYDGVSVEAEVTDHIISAYSRGDTANDRAADLTPVLGGYKFHYAPSSLNNEEPIGMKFEAMLLRRDVDYYSQYRNYPYCNARNAMTGLLGSSDAYDYRDLITLIPLATSIEGLDRVTEIEFMNKYYNSGEYLRYAVLKGTYNEILYQVYRFEQEAEYLRPVMPMDYDGIVVSYANKDLIEALGRENFVNKYSVAIKFNPMQRNAVFTGYDYTIGQNGTITPMIHYTPVEFFGTIHDKSSGHSYARFMNLGLRIGDIVDVAYVNDVMPYVTKSNSAQNQNNQNPIVEFPSVCPCCGTPIVILPGDKTAVCPNINCSARASARVSNMMHKLGLKDFGDSRLSKLGITSFHEVIMYPEENARSILGDLMTDKFMDVIQQIKFNPIPDYILMGSIGFSNIAAETWKKILSVVNLNAFEVDDDINLKTKLSGIKGIGPSTIGTIIDERRQLADDISAIIHECNPIISYGQYVESIKGKIRLTGFRDQVLMQNLSAFGWDASDGSVTKDTRILLIPYEGFESTKVSKARKYGVEIIPVNEFDLTKY